MKFQDLSEISNVRASFDHARNRFLIANDQHRAVVAASLIDKRTNNQMRLTDSALIEKITLTIADHYEHEMQLLREELVQLGVDYESIPMS